MLKIRVVKAMLRVTTAVAISLLVAFSASAQTVRYVHTDGLGSVVLTTDKDRNIIERSEYEPYGSLLNRALADGPGYTGHVMDAATGLTYMQQRYYESDIGTFLSVDPVTAYEKPITNFNRYVYGLNNPYKFTDPDGRQTVGEMIDDNAMSAASRGEVATTYGWAFAAGFWKYLGAENVSKITDKGFTDASTSDKVGAGMEVLAALPPVKIVGEAAAIGKEAITAARATEGAIFATTKEATSAAKSMGFTRINGEVHGQAVYKRGKDYITRDADGHNGGAWKMADSVKGLFSKETRAGTYSADLKKRVGD